MCCFTRQLHVRGSNIDVNKLESRVVMQHFLSQAFKKNYIAILSRMLLEDVMQVPPLLMPQAFVYQFVFIWGCE
jgi:hypothetical protein